MLPDFCYRETRLNSKSLPASTSLVAKSCGAAGLRQGPPARRIVQHCHHLLGDVSPKAFVRRHVDRSGPRPSRLVARGHGRTSSSDRRGLTAVVSPSLVHVVSVLSVARVVGLLERARIHVGVVWVRVHIGGNRARLEGERDRLDEGHFPGTRGSGRHALRNKLRSVWVQRLGGRGIGLPPLGGIGPVANNGTAFDGRHCGRD